VGIRAFIGAERGFLRGLNSVAEVFSSYSSEHEYSLLGEMRSDWSKLGQDLRIVLGAISARWSGPLPPPAELGRIDQIIPGGADRLLRMAEKEQSHRIEDAKRGQYLGWSLAAGAVIAAALVSLGRGPWQVSVALVGIPVLGAVQALIQGRKEKGGKRVIRWF
jgi:hypothetical protein